MNEQYPENPQRKPIAVELDDENAAKVRVRTETAISIGQAIVDSEAKHAEITPVPVDNPNLITEIPAHLRPQQ